MFVSEFERIGVEIPYGKTSGQVKCTCPNCRNHRGNPRDRSLSVNLDTGSYTCHHCGWSGNIVADLKSKSKEHMSVKKFVRPKPRPLPKHYSEKLLAYFNKRGISEGTMLKAKVGEGREFFYGFGERNAILFNYYLDGELVNVKSRDGQKHFVLCKNAELIPYNIDSIAGKDTCVITEGEFDCLSFIEIGIDPVISVPNGANSNLSFLDRFVESHFEDKKCIYIASDTDEKGSMLKDELLRRLGSDRCRIITYGKHKDANELLQNEGREALRAAYDNAVEVPIAGVFTVADYEPELDDLFRHGLQKGLSIGHQAFDDICTFETKRVGVVTGMPGSGKSEFLDEICTRLNLKYDFKVAYFSPENMPLQLHAAKIIEKITGAKLEQRSMSDEVYEMAKRYVEENFFHILPEESYTLTNILSLAKSLVRKKGIRILVIDPFNRVESERNSKETETEYISKFIDRLTNFAAQNDCLVFLMAHPRKPDTKNKDYVPTTYDIAGSGHFFNKCDYSIIVNRKREDKVTDIIVEKVKFRHLGEGGKASFKYDTENGRYVDIDENGYGKSDRRNYLVENPFKDGASLESYREMYNRLKGAGLSELLGGDFAAESENVFAASEIVDNNIPF